MGILKNRIDITEIFYLGGIKWDFEEVCMTGEVYVERTVETSGAMAKFYDSVASGYLDIYSTLFLEPVL